MKTLIEHGIYYHRRKGWPAGVWWPSNSPIDRVLRYVLEELGMTTRGGITSLLRGCNIKQEVVTRHRKAKSPVLPQHLAVLSLYSGIPLAELAELGCTEYATHPERRLTP